jgi:hypothetical protein
MCGQSCLAREPRVCCGRSGRLTPHVLTLGQLRCVTWAWLTIECMQNAMCRMNVAGMLYKSPASQAIND